MSVLRDAGDAAKGDAMNKGRKGGTKGRTVTSSYLFSQSAILNMPGQIFLNLNLCFYSCEKVLKYR